jgi:hypothetical protein
VSGFTVAKFPFIDETNFSMSLICEDELFQSQISLFEDIEYTLTHNEKNEKKKQLKKNDR